MWTIVHSSRDRSFFFRQELANWWKFNRRVSLAMYQLSLIGKNKQCKIWEKFRKFWKCEKKLVSRQVFIELSQFWLIEIFSFL